MNQRLFNLFVSAPLDTSNNARLRRNLVIEAY